jgi:signal transduction histidine kinase
MYFVDFKKRLAADSIYVHLLPTIAVLVTLLGLTLLTWHNTDLALQNEYKATTASLSTHTSNVIVERLRTYDVVLEGASGLFIASNDVTRNEWRLYAQGLDLQQKFPGIQGIGYVSFVRPEQVRSFTEAARRDGMPGFRIFPDGQRQIYSAALYFEPSDDPNIGLGFDMYNEPVRREAMVWAQTTGEPTLTGQLKLLIGNDVAGENGFLMFVPVYASGSEYSRPANERNVKGFTFAPFVGQNVFSQVLDDSAKDAYGVRIFDGPADKNNILYETSGYSGHAAEDHTGSRQTLKVYGREWTLDFRYSPNIVSASARNRPITSLISGITLSFLLAGLVLMLLTARTKALAKDKQTEVQSAKDELLSLASHQLRTPATAVKQYIGMLKEGYGGSMNEQQLALLEKAFVSNERQLHIINELLYVAKIDAKGIVLSPQRLDITKLVKDIVREISDTAKKTKMNKINVQLPKRKIFAVVDEHCIHMAVENLIMNAVNYSYEHKPVKVKVTSGRDEVVISVSDKGVGIAPEELPMLFQQFTRIPNELTRKTSGSGIGLYLSQQLIQLHGGKIEVESKQGKGSTFTIILPKNKE